MIILKNKYVNINKLIKISFAIFALQKIAVVLLCAGLLTASGCGKQKLASEDDGREAMGKDAGEEADLNCGQPFSLKDTKWKVVGLVNNKTGEIDEYEPKDCEECFTLWFDTDYTATAIYINTRHRLDLLDLDPFRPHLKAVEHSGGEMYEKDLKTYWDSYYYSIVLFMIESYSATCNELRLHHVSGEYDLLYAPCDYPLEKSIIGTCWNLDGLFDTQTGEKKELEAKDPEVWYHYSIRFYGNYYIGIISELMFDGFSLLDIPRTGEHKCPNFPEIWSDDFSWYGEDSDDYYKDQKLFHWGIVHAKSYELTSYELKIFFNSPENHDCYFSFKCTYK